ncbi:hypothetical protein CC85DRAFT_314240 [Cutaneotrichosporon oleaginosum]|uniref:Zn(2)-C6 fungal-type domain-containing protein n=1 Tax=Cutaneotrichosporon oleaginosum TaxID=879819 RepID=A0A0J0XCJ2_9TREE|nr:uncharacterized protein CC85DRAFT_314240 [Cutaneotrichosporon oleaginosum]KLT38776.1 hypothetical protein CC85DRAFT_314240 [Cutaneotrichosporon oleaginosum]TXT11502.1 hypothetical protein COLE_01912 [Cutaneotrichosporon oleaginosum]
MVSKSKSPETSKIQPLQSEHRRARQVTACTNCRQSKIRCAPASEVTDPALANSNKCLPCLRKGIACDIPQRLLEQNHANEATESPIPRVEPTLKSPALKPDAPGQRPAPYTPTQRPAVRLTHPLSFMRKVCAHDAHHQPKTNPTEGVVRAAMILCSFRDPIS